MLRRTHTCGELRDLNVGQTVRLNGWVNSYRGHGTGLVFIDIRDRFGVTQAVFDGDSLPKDILDTADHLRNEDVVAVEGTVRVRAGGENPKLVTGKIEIEVTKLEVLNKTANPPFLPDDTGGGGKLANEELRLKHRYIDLRRPSMQKAIATRHKV